jgi:transaldolase/glucose-6-phosphate isomerase
MSYALNSLNYLLPETLDKAFRSSLDDWKKNDKIGRLWQKDAGVWTGSDEGKWLAWLDSVDAELADLQKYRDFAADVKDFESVVLLGMGGSSLCPEVLAITFGVKNFYVLDSTDPAQVKSVEEKVDLTRTLFIVASKSGSTLEPNCFKQYFYQRMIETVGAEKAGAHFVAVTDPGSKMQAVAERDGFRRIFFGNPEIGGRFSALSPFGMCALSAMQLDVEDFLNRAAAMAEACRNPNPAENPGVILGTILGTAHAQGRDKLTIFTSPEIYDVGAWLEQLIAESTGKEGVSIIPIDREPALEVEDYTDDRVFVYLKLKGENGLHEKLDVLAAHSHPTVIVELGEKEDLGQEFFRWEFATAVAGSIMKINPFNQPDVEAAKIEARKITEEYEQTGELPEETPIFEADGVKLFTSPEYAKSLDKRVGREKTLAKYLESHILHLQENDYFALLAYVEMNSENEKILQEIRERVLRRELTATCLGFGPRFLHSTGQAYKGGANNGVFLQITADDAVDFEVPEQKFTFGVVKAAQARGDFQVLLDRKRRALRVHLGRDVQKGLETILKNV